MSEAKTEDELYAMRHSLAHIMATAIKRQWPDVKLGIGPVVKDGFYYDIDLGDGRRVSDENFKNLEKEMHKIINEDQPFVESDMSIKDAKKWAKVNDQPYKLELLEDLQTHGRTDIYGQDGSVEVESEYIAIPVGKGASKQEALNKLRNNRDELEVSFYTNGDFTDLCRGPHVESTGKVGAFKLMRVAGAYWRGDENKPQMQRVYGVAFKTQKELDKHLHMLEEAKKRDHRKLGKELDLFTFSPLVGSGLPLFTPKGATLRRMLGEYSLELKKKLGFEEVWVPHMTKKDLYEKSGHWDKFGDELFLVESQETSDELVLKPMNCPHHTQIYASQPRSYRDLPLKYMENTTVYRDEKSGELHGLERVRSITQDDSHTFCTEDQVSDSVGGLIDVIQELYATVGMPIKRVHLSFRDDEDQYLGDASLWDKAQNELKELAEKNALEYVIDPGEAAFYGPKIDFIAEDAIGRTTQVATVQLDFVQPERFELEYISEDGSAKRPVMIHCALLGSIERFLSVYIEHTAGKFPLWLAPEQVRIATVNQEEATVSFAEELLASAKEYGVRAVLDNDNESVGKKIRRAEVEKVPYTLVIGDKEVESGKVVPRVRNDIAVDEKEEPIETHNFIQTVANESKAHVSKTSLFSHKKDS